MEVFGFCLVGPRDYRVVMEFLLYFPFCNIKGRFYGKLGCVLSCGVS